MATYRFSTGVPNITPAVYAATDTAEASDLNTGDTATDSAGVLTLTLDVGRYYAKWRVGSAATYVTARGEVVQAAAQSGGSSLPSPSPGDAGKAVVVTESEDGFELAAASGGGPLPASNTLFLSFAVTPSGTTNDVDFAGQTLVDAVNGDPIDWASIGVDTRELILEPGFYALNISGSVNSVGSGEVSMNFPGAIGPSGPLVQILNSKYVIGLVEAVPTGWGAGPFKAWFTTDVEPSGIAFNLGIAKILDA